MMLMPLMLTACATAAPPKIVSDACLNFRNISFALLPRTETQTALAQGRAVRDDGNKADTPETVDEISVHNARYDALCPKPPVKAE